MDDTYDCVILGTGLTECIISGLLSVEGKKVLHLDRNSYYGAESTSLNLNQLFQQFKDGKTPPTELGQSRDYNVDIIPKFIMAAGGLVDMLLHTDVTRYLEFQSVNGSYVYKDKKIFKVPASDTEALKSSLIGLMEKRRLKNFLQFILEFEENDPKTHNKMDLNQMTMEQCFAKYSLDANTIDFLGHAVALYDNDSYLKDKAIVSIKKMKLYYESLSRYGKSPYIYPLYGLGELPQSFARLSAIYGGTYMLNAPIDGYEFDGKAIKGVKSKEGTVAKCSFVVGDPSYFPERCKSTGKVVRVICLLNHPVPNTDDSKSCQIIIPQKQVGRTNDIYVCVMSFAHSVVPKDMWVAIVATKVENESGNPLDEVRPGLNLLGPIMEQFVSVCPTYEPTDDGSESKIFISKSYDASTHFESTIDDVMDLYKRITGKTLVLDPNRSQTKTN